MLRKILAVAGSIVFLLLSFKAVKAEDLKMQSYLYIQGFEGEADPVQAYSGGDAYTVNFKGLTEEKSFSGKKCFKLDITFQSNSSIFWSIPIPGVPVEGKLQFSGRIFLGEETAGGANAGLGINYDFPPTSQLASNSFATISNKGEWKLIEGDVVSLSKELKPWLMERPAWPWLATEENVGVHTEGIGLFLYGGEKGKRIVVYVDDLKIEGEAPAEEAYQAAIKKKWIPLNEKIAEKISSWENALRESEKELNSLVNLSPEADALNRKTKKRIAFLKERVANVKKTGHMTFPEEKGLDFFPEQLKNAINNIKANF